MAQRLISYLAAHGPCLVKINVIKDWISSAKVFGMPLSIRKHKPRERRRKVLIRAETSMLYIEPCEEKSVLWVWATSVKSQFLFVPVLAEK